MSGKGWIRLHRKIRDNPVFNDFQLYRLWTICLTEASHKERDQVIGKQVVKLMPGQFITGRYDLHEMYNNGLKRSDKVAEYTVWRWLKSLEKHELLSINSSNKFTIITVRNWSLYQDSEQEVEHQNEQQVSNKRASNEQQVSTNKNYKNYKNYKNDISSSGIGEIDPIFGQAYEMMSQHFHFMNAIQQDEISRYLNNGMEIEVLEEAITKTKLIGRDLSYLFGILRKCEEQGIKTLDQYKEREAQHKREKEIKQQRQQRSNANKPAKPVIPVMSNTPTGTMPSQEELERALEMARRLDRERKP